MRRLPPFLAALAIVLAACLLPAAPALAAKDYYSMKDEKLVKLAGKGDREAIGQLTRPHRINRKTQGSEPRPIEERLPWLLKGAELDVPYARSMLGMHLLTPSAGTAPDYGGAAHWLALAMKRFPAGAETTHQEARDLHAAMTHARRMHAVTTTPPADTPEALFEAAQAYKPVRIFRDTLLGDDAEFRRLIRRAAELGHGEAQVQMPGLAASREEAVEWRRKLAERGDVAAMEGMAAELAMLGKKAESQDWHRRAAEAGSSNSAYWYGWYLQGTGAKAEAIPWYEKAAAAGHKEAQAQLHALVDPYVVRLVEAAGRGDGAAALELGGYYRKKGDLERARFWYSRADEFSSLEGTYQYALLLKEPASRGQYMQKAAQRGHAGAQAWLANDVQRGQRALQQAAQQMEAEKRQAFVARIEREGSTDKLEVEYYCQYGGRRCNELRGIAHRAEQGRNAQVQSDNMRRIQDAHSSKGDSDAAARARSECMRRKTESIQRKTYGQQDWKFEGEC